MKKLLAIALVLCMLVSNGLAASEKEINDFIYQYNEFCCVTGAPKLSLNQYVGPITLSSGSEADSFLIGDIRILVSNSFKTVSCYAKDSDAGVFLCVCLDLAYAALNYNNIEPLQYSTVLMQCIFTDYIFATAGIQSSVIPSPRYTMQITKNDSGYIFVMVVG